MLAIRVIPILLYNGTGLVKSVKFSNYKYIGDAVNAVKILNEKEVDELILLDITATPQNRKPNFRLLNDIASECFMPLCYGGGVRSLEDIKQIFKIGVEKVSVNTAAVGDPDLVRKAAELFGSQSIVLSIDVRRSFLGKYEIYSHGGKNPTGLDPVKFLMNMEDLGAGEILLNSVDRDGTMIGYDIELIKKVTKAVSIPVVACGGAGKIQDFVKAIRVGGASAVAAGSMFVLHGKHRAVLISYPSQEDLKAIFCKELTLGDFA
jgi:cyclase